MHHVDAGQDRTRFGAALHLGALSCSLTVGELIGRQGLALHDAIATGPLLLGALLRVQLFKGGVAEGRRRERVVVFAGGCMEMELSA